MGKRTGAPSRKAMHSARSESVADGDQTQADQRSRRPRAEPRAPASRLANALRPTPEEIEEDRALVSRVLRDSHRRTRAGAH